MKNTQAIFISSTFLDMQTERDVIRDRVIPEFCDIAKKYGLFVESIDLRWGINTNDIDEATASIKILQSCFDEIRRTRPFFILLVGERYGWVPDAKDVKASLESSGVGEISIAGKSITELEVTFAMESYPSMERCFFYFRNPVDFGADEQAKAKYVSPNRNAINQFKLSIEQRYPDQVRHYDARWDSEHQCFVGLDAFEAMVKADVGNALAETLSQLNAPKNWVEELINVQNMFVEQSNESFTGRRAELEEIQEFFTSDRDNVLVIKGNSGSGKSSLLAKIVTSASSDTLLIPFFVGVHSQASVIENMIVHACYRLRMALDGFVPEDFFENSIEDFATELYDLLPKVAEKQSVVLLIDALDQLSPSVYDKDFKWLNPFALPARVKIVMSTTSDYHQVKYLDTLDRRQLDLDVFTREDIAAVTVRYFEMRHKEIHESVVRAIVDKDATSNPCASPIYLLTLLQELNYLGAEDFAAIDEMKAQGYAPGDAIITYLSQMVQTAPATSQALLEQFVEKNARKIGESTLDIYLCLLANSVNGVPEYFVADVCALLGVENDAATFACFRKLFYTQLCQKTNGQWDFNHGLIKTFYARREGHAVTRGAILDAAVSILRQQEDSPFKQVNFASLLGMTGHIEWYVEYWQRDVDNSVLKDAISRELRHDIRGIDTLFDVENVDTFVLVDTFISMLQNKVFGPAQSEYIVCRLLNEVYSRGEQLDAPYRYVYDLYVALGDVATDYGYYRYALDAYFLARNTAMRFGYDDRLVALYSKIESVQIRNGSLTTHLTYRRHQDFLARQTATKSIAEERFHLTLASNNHAKTIVSAYKDARVFCEGEDRLSLLCDLLLVIKSPKQLVALSADIDEAKDYANNRNTILASRLSYALWRVLWNEHVADAHTYLIRALDIIRKSANGTVEVLELYNQILYECTCYAHIHRDMPSLQSLIKERLVVLRQLQYRRSDYHLVDETVQLYEDAKRFCPDEYEPDLHRQYKGMRRQLLKGHKDAESILSDKLLLLTASVVLALYFIIAPLLLLTVGPYVAFQIGFKNDQLIANFLSAVFQAMFITTALFAVYGIITVTCKETPYRLRRKWVWRTIFTGAISAVLLGTYLSIFENVIFDGYAIDNDKLQQFYYTIALATEFYFLVVVLMEIVAFAKRERYVRLEYAWNYRSFVRNLPHKMMDLALRVALLVANEALFYSLTHLDTLIEDEFMIIPLEWHWGIAGVLAGLMLLRCLRLWIIRGHIRRHG